MTSQNSKKAKVIKPKMSSNALMLDIPNLADNDANTPNSDTMMRSHTQRSSDGYRNRVL